MKSLRLVLLLALGAVLLSSCTLVAPNAAPLHVPRSNVPLGLLHKTIPGTNGARVRFVHQPVYIVDATGQLAPSNRIVPSPPTLTSVVQQLLLGPSAIEASAGYTSALPTNLVLDSATVRNDVGYINLASSLDTLSVSQQLLAVGQLVLTADEVGATGGIVVQAAGVVQQLLTPGGQRRTLVSSKDFLSLLNG
ncbi:MAG TPA: GerMN domain-containing protein [Acidimicrobiales bacterium]|nr:GerMN domain-containing protein [Acidimicrobiales bacterium]